MKNAHRTALQHALRVVDLRLREVGDPTPAAAHGDPADVLAAREEHEHQVLGHAGLMERRRLILAALAKVGTEAEGRCCDCCEVIPAKRLAAIPWALRCLICEARYEQAAVRAVEPWLPKPMAEDGQ